MKYAIALILLGIYTITQSIAYIPQIYKLLKTKKADDLSLSGWLIWFVSDFSYLGYILLETPEIGLICATLWDIFLILTTFLLTWLYQTPNKLLKVKK